MAADNGQQNEVEQLRAKIAALQADLKEKEAQGSLVYPYSRTYGRTPVVSILGAADGGKSLVRAWDR